MRPGMPKAASITSIASNNSQACACTCVPIICAFKKYSSLWMTTRNISDAIATGSETLRLKITMIALERRFPTTGSRPTRKVMTSTVLASGRCTSANGNATKRYNAVRKVLTAEMRVWANTTRRNASPTRTTRSRMALASGPRGSWKKTIKFKSICLTEILPNQLFRYCWCFFVPLGSQDPNGFFIETLRLFCYFCATEMPSWKHTVKYYSSQCPPFYF